MTRHLKPAAATFLGASGNRLAADVFGETARGAFGRAADRDRRLARRHRGADSNDRFAAAILGFVERRKS